MGSIREHWFVTLDPLRTVLALVERLIDTDPGACRTSVSLAHHVAELLVIAERTLVPLQ